MPGANSTEYRGGNMTQSGNRTGISPVVVVGMQHQVTEPIEEEPKTPPKTAGLACEISDLQVGERALTVATKTRGKKLNHLGQLGDEFGA